MQTYLTRAGDVLDAIAFQQYGYCDDSVLAQVIAANDGITAHGAVMPSGLTIVLPDIDAEQASDAAVSLWD